MNTFRLLAAMAASTWALPPGAPMSDFGPKQVAISASFDHNGLFLYDDKSPCIFNSVGLGAEYAPWRFIQIGAFVGAAEFDIGVPPSRINDSNAFAFNSSYNLTGGGSLKLATPRFARESLRLVVYGSAQWLQAQDDFSNERLGLYYQTGGSIQWSPMAQLTLVFGGEYHTLDGTQKNGAGAQSGFGLEGLTSVEYMRGLIGVEYVLPQKNRPFMNVSLRPTGGLGWEENLGIQGASLSVTFGVMTDIGKATVGHQEEENFGHLED
jgi:hypothetical protein